MNKDYLLELAQYNVWANELMKSWLNELNETQWTQSLVGSFDSIAATVLHLAGAEKVWYERLNHKAEEFLSVSFNGTKDDLLAIWTQATDHLQTYVSTVPESELETYFPYKNLKGEDLTLKRHQAIVHVFNHSTYHRGQLVNYLRQVGFTQVSSTDMSTFYLLKNSGKG
ncbi:MAG: DinB family protein [Spirosomataceae bacterium]